MSKREIVDAAKTLLWERGYESMSPRSLMDLSGAGQGSLYHHFKGKKDIAATALDEVADELLTAFEEAFSGALPPLERIRRYLDQPRDGLKGCRLGRLANETSLIGDDDLRAALAGYFDVVEGKIGSALKEAQKRGEIPHDLDAANLAATIVATVQGGYVLSRATGDAGAIARACAGLKDMIDELAG